MHRESEATRKLQLTFLCLFLFLPTRHANGHFVVNANIASVFVRTSRNFLVFKSWAVVRGHHAMGCGFDFPAPPTRGGCRNFLREGSAVGQRTICLGIPPPLFRFTPQILHMQKSRGGSGHPDTPSKSAPESRSILNVKMCFSA